MESAVNCTLWNVRSANYKLSDITQFMSDENTDMLILSETWQSHPKPGKLDTFKATFEDFAEAEELDVNLFTAARCDGRKGGGVALASKKSLSVSHYSLDFELPTSFEYLSVKCKFSQPFILVCLYRSSSSSSANFITDFSELLTALSLITLPSVVAGDFNIRINISGDPVASSFKTLLDEFNFSILPLDQPTHIQGNTLDFAVVMNSFLYKCSSCSVGDYIPITDHLPVSFCIDHSISERSATQVRYKTYSTLDDETFSSVLEDALSQLPDDNDISFSSYLSGFRNALSTTFLENSIVKQISESQAPWMDREYISARSLRKRLQMLPNKSRYNAQSRLCARMANEKRTAYFSNLIISSCNQKDLYKTMHKLTGRKKECSKLAQSLSPQDTANSMNRFFVQKVSDIRDSLPNADVTDLGTSSSTTSNLEQSFGLSSFSPTCYDELSKLVREHGIKIGPGDILPPHLMKKHIEILLPHLVKLVNLSLSTASCDGIKEAHITPILKALSLDFEVFKNYRPVSILSFISKLTERVVHSRLTSYLNENSLHSPSQFGYKKHHSCETMLLKLIDDILIGIDQKFGVIVLMVDLTAAFDTVDHSHLFNMLQFKYRITGAALTWLKSFVTGRSQRVKVGDFLSNALLVSFGVPQGSILGPLLFNLYCSSINTAFEEAGFSSMGYADDNLGVRLFPAFVTPSTLLFSVANCLRSIHRWTDKYFLKLNSGKTQVMVFGDNAFRRGLDFNTFRNEFGDMCPLSRCVKLLGVKLDNKLEFDSHISDLVSSMNFSLRNIHLIRKMLTVEAAEMLVHSVITNKLDMCNSIFMGLSASNLAKLQRVQHFALRVVLNLPARSHVSNHMRNRHWLKVEARIHYKYLVLIFKCINSIAPIPLASKLRIRHAIDMLLDANYFKPTSLAGRKSFSYLAPRCWNALPRYLRVCTFLDNFKPKLKHYLFDNFDEYKHSIFPYSTEAISQNVMDYSFVTTRPSLLLDTDII